MKNFKWAVYGIVLTSMLFNHSYNTLRAKAADVTVLAVKQDSFTASDVNTYFKRVGTTYHSGSGVYLVNNGEQQAGSFFTNEKISLPNSTTAGFSTYFEISTWGGGGPAGFGDGWTFVVSKNTNVLGDSGGAIGYGGIANSVAILFDSFDNGGQSPYCVSLGINGGQQACQHLTSTLSNNFRIWVDYSKASNSMELRINLSNNIRPATPWKTYSNLDLSNIGNEFYTGFTSSTGGAIQYTYLSKWYFSASFLTNGIDPTQANNYIEDKTPPPAPTLSPELTSAGTQFTLTPGVDDLGGEQILSYSFDDGVTWLPYNDVPVVIPGGVRKVLAKAIDQGSNASPITTYNFYAALLHANYSGGVSPTLLYPQSVAVDLYELSRPGYKLLGYTTSPTSSNVVHSVTLTSNQTFYAQWEWTSINVQFIDGTDVTTLTGYYQDPMSIETPIKEGYQFLGWFENMADSTPVNMTTFPGWDLSLYAKWATQAYTVQLSYGDTTITQTIEHGQVINVDDIVLPPHLILQGWYTDDQYSDPFDLSNAIESNANMYGKILDISNPLNWNAYVDSMPWQYTPNLNDELNTAQTLLEEMSQDELEHIDPIAYNHYLELLIGRQYQSEIDDVLQMITRLYPIATLDDRELIQAARLAYDALSLSQQNDIPSDVIGRLIDLEKQVNDLQESLEFQAALACVEMPLSIGDAEDVFNVFHLGEELSMDAWLRLDAQDRAQYSYLISIRQDYQDALDFMQLVQEVSETQELPIPDRYLNQLYDALSQLSQQAKEYVPNETYSLWYLIDQNSKDYLIVEQTLDQIGPLPTEITESNREQVESIIALYDGLTERQRRFVPDSVSTAIENLRSELNRPIIDPIEPPPPLPPDEPLPSDSLLWLILYITLGWGGAIVVTTRLQNKS